MERILIIGCPGGGKTTLATALSEKLSIPVVHLDKLFWKAGWQERTREEFDKLLMLELVKPKWIMDGNFSRTMPTRLERCDTVIYLDLPRRCCIYGVLKRVISCYGKSRPDMGDGCPERFDFGFIKYVWNFNKKHRPHIYKLLKERQNIDCIILRSRRDVNKFLYNISENRDKL